MSQDSNDGSSAKPSIPPAATSGAVSKRPSLKELAARASQANAAGSPSIRPPASMPPPASEAVAQDKLSRPSSPSPSVVPPKASVPPPRPLEAGKEDSGRVDLNAINQAATPAQIAAAEVAKPAAHDLVSDAAGEDKPAAANDSSEGAKVKNISDARAKKSKKKSEAAKTNEAVASAETAAPVAETAKKKEDEGGGGKWAALVAILAIAAGAFFMLRNKEQPKPPPVAAVQPKQEAAQAAVDTKKIEEPKPASTGLSIDSLPAAEPAESAKVAPGPKVAAAPVETAAPPPVATEPVAPTAVPTATGGGKVGDLASEMAKSVGGSSDKPVNADDATPAAGKTGSQTIPEQPSQGAANAAVRPLAANAKSCVAGADDVSYASVTFSSAGTVSSVNVSGWAAKNGKSDCIKSALKGANVGPFAKPSFTVSVPIRP